jgi:RsiW-degrading membrane proteinase PrsW (M82 family)
VVPHAPPSVALAAIVGAAPSLFLLVFFYLKDRYEPEPRGHVALAFAKGAVATLPAYAASWALARVVGDEFLVLGGLPARAFDAVVLAALCEELPKWIAFLFIYRWNEFDEPLDGVVYGVAVALGFATLENFLFVARLGLGVAWMRALFAVPAHALFGATMGYYAGRAKFDRGGKLWRDRALCLFAPTAFHGCYDYALHRGMGAHVWIGISLLSVGLWTFVLRRVHRAQHASPFRTGGDR